METKRYRWLLSVVRYGLCAAAILFLVFTVPWHDQVHLNDAAKTRVRLIAQRGDEFVIRHEGQTQTVGPAAIHFAEIGGQLVPDVEPGMRSVVLESDPGLALWAVVLFAPVSILAAIRLVWMLAVQRMRLSLWNAIKLTFAGNFFNFALPGMTGGDLIKAYYITRFTHRKTEAVTTIFLDRVIGLASFVIMAALMLLIAQDSSRLGGLALPLGLILAGLAVGAVIVYSRRIRKVLRLRQIVERLPLSHQLQRIADATLAMRQHKTLVLLSLLITFVLQTVVILSAIVMARALHMEGSFASFFVYIAIGYVIAAVPISPPQAIGVMEFFYVLFFTADGRNTASQAVALAVAARLIQLLWALPGVLVPLFGTPMPTRAELKQLEDPDAQQPSAPDDSPAAAAAQPDAPLGAQPAAES